LGQPAPSSPTKTLNIKVNIHNSRPIKANIRNNHIKAIHHNPIQMIPRCCRLARCRQLVHTRFRRQAIIKIVSAM